MRGNLPQQLTSFVGREREIGEIKRALESARLVSLAGAGGCGKTRLSLEVARYLLGSFPDGVWFVELAALTDPELVPQAAAAALGVREEPGRSLMPALLDYLRPLKLLLVMDNCEHLIRACASFAETLLRACPELRILATTREALDVAGELSWPVPPLSLPGAEDEATVESLESYEAVKLFIDRARFSRQGFTLTAKNAPLVAALCTRLDGLPLAIELAAARMNVLTVEQIVERLDARFRLLTSGSRSALPRQQTLQALLDWSYDLLSEEERALLRSLSVFAGGSSLEAIKAVCAGHGDAGEARVGDEFALIDLLSRLVQKSLVIADEYGTEARYRMLDTIRQYAWERRESEDGPPARLGQHRDWYLQLAETAQPELTGEDQETWLDRLEIEHDNLRAALDWSIKGDHNAEAAMRLSAALWRFWDTRGYITEGRRWLRESLAMTGEVSPLVRARAVSAAGNLAIEQGEYDLARALHNEALALRRGAGDKHAIANSLNNLGVLARRLGEYDHAAEFEEECLVIFRELELKYSIASVLSNLGFVEQCRGNYERAEALGTEALGLVRENGDTLGIIIALNNLGDLARFRERYERATELYEEAMGLARALGDPLSVVGLLNNQGAVANRRGDFKRATELYLESLFKCKKLVHKQGIAECLEGLATAEMRGNPERAARLFGAAETIRETILAPLLPPEQRFYRESVDKLRAALGEKTFTSAWAEARAMELDEAIEFATQGATAGARPAPATPSTAAAGENNAAGLTRREIEVLRLAASGLKATQIAVDLDLSDRTVNAHLHSVYGKIGVTSRAAATRFAIEHKLI